MKCKYCGGEFTPNKTGKKKEYCNKEECIKKAKNETQRKWYANKMNVLNGAKARVVEQAEEKKIIYSSTDKALNSVKNEDFSDVISIARKLGAVIYEIDEELKKHAQKQSSFDKCDQVFLHKLEEFAKEDEIYEDELMEVVREHINARQNRRVVKDKEEILRQLKKGVISNPNEYVVQFIKSRNQREYKGGSQKVDRQ